MNKEITLPRQKMSHNGWPHTEYIKSCDCGEKSRGPIGGVCGNCGGAIATKEEDNKIYNFKTGPGLNLIQPVSAPYLQQPERTMNDHTK